MTAAFGQDGRAHVVAGAPAIVALQLLEADGTTPQDLAGRTFVYSVWRPGDGSVVGDFVGLGDDAVIEDGRTIIKLGPTGDETLEWDLGPMRRADLAWAIYELTGEGRPIWWPADGRPALYQVTGARDDSDFPVGPGPSLEGPYAVIQLGGTAGSAVVLGISAIGAPGAPGSTAEATADAVEAIRDGVDESRDTLAKLSDAVDAADTAEATARASGDTAAINSALATIRGGVDAAYDTLAKAVAAFQAADQALAAALAAQASAETAALALKADKTVTIAVAGLLQGGGTLATNFTLTVTEASQAEAQAGTSSTVVATPRRVADYVSARAGTAGGLATLDGGGKVPAAQLPNAIMEYQGTWNASTNTPTLADGTGSAGNVYRVSVAGTQNLGSGAIDFGVGDYAIHNGSTWEKADTTDAVASVAGRTGAVTLTTADLGDLATGMASFLTTPSSANLRAAMTDESGTGALYFQGGALGAPASGTLTNCSGLPIGGVSGLGTGVATFLATPSSANLVAALTDETGTGALVFANTPTLVTPVLGVASGTRLTLAAGSVAVSTPVLDISQTWNAGAVAFTAAKVNITDTTSAAGSLLLDLQVGGTSKFKVDKSGNWILAAAQLSVTNFSTLAFDGTLYFGGASGAASRAYAGNGFVVASNMAYGFSSTTAANGTVDGGISRTGAAAMAVGNGTPGNASGSLSMAGLTLSGTGFNATGLATADPHVVGRVWANAGVMTVSAG
jgi:hypothetical protein